MAVDLRKFFQVTNPDKALAVDNPEDKKYYIDFSSVRGGEIIKKLKQKITFFSPDTPTCVLFTGHIGCGKSTELMRLRTELEQEGFHVVYFESSEVSSCGAETVAYLKLYKVIVVGSTALVLVPIVRQLPPLVLITPSSCGI